MEYIKVIGIISFMHGHHSVLELEKHEKTSKFNIMEMY